MAEMDESELKSIVAAEIKAALGYIGGDLTAQRKDAMERYLGEPYGNEDKFRSKVVSSDIMDTVEGIMPHLLKMFASGDEVVRFEPQGPEDEDVAKQATEYVNWIFTRDNDGFKILYSWFKDALLQKNGIVKAWWEKGEKWNKETYYGLSDDAYNLVLADVKSGDIELVAHSEMPDPYGMPGPDGPAMLHDVIVRKSEEYGCIKVCPVPPEEFLISREARDIYDARFVGHRRRRTVSDLLEEGYPKKVVESLPSSEDASTFEESLARNTVEDNTVGGDPTNNRAMQLVWTTEAYIRVDYDGDGIAEMRKITVGGSGNEILANEEWDAPIPFAALTPILMPHRFFGLSMADLLQDVQLIKTTLMRQLLDNLYRAANPMKEVVEANIVDPNEVLQSRPDGIVRVKAQGSITPLVTPFVGDAAITGIEYMDQVRENRSGFNRYAQGSDANAINKTATGVVQLQNAAMERILLIARLFAETGVKDLFRLILKMVSKYQDKERVIKLRNQWVPMNPREWSSEFDMSINVGLGTGNKDQELAKVMGLAQLMQPIVQAQGGPNGPVVTWQNIYNLGKVAQEASGFKQPDYIFTDPQGKQPPPPPPDPKVEAMKMKAQIDQQKAQADIQAKQADVQIKRETAQMDMQQAVMEMQLEMQKFRMEMAQERARFDMERQQDQLRFGQEMRQSELQGRVSLEQAQQQGEQKLALAEQAARQKAKQPENRPAK